MKPKTLYGVMASTIILGVVCGIFYYNNIVNKETLVYVPSLLEKEASEIENSEVMSEEIEQVEEETIEEEKAIVYDNMTLEELTDKLNRVLSSDLTDMGYAFANYSIELGVDPYLAVAIAMHETGCTWNCSYLTKACNNVGGQKGTGCGEYQAFDNLETGIYGFISNIRRNYVDYGLMTAEEMNPKYAEDTSWSSKVNTYIEKIKNS